MKKIIVFIINPHAGTGKYQKVENAIRRYLNPQKYDFEINYTQAPKHAVELSQHAVNNGADAVVAVGGDGTVNEVGGPLIGTSVALGVIPTGSGNALARHIKMSMRVRTAIRQIGEMNLERIDTGTLEGHKFINCCGVGFDAHVSKIFSTYKKRGFQSYARLISKEVLTYKPREFVIRYNGKTFIQEAFIICAANSSEYGNHAKIAPDADISDGYLDLCVVNDFPRYKTALMTIRLFNETIMQSKYIDASRVKKVTISRKEPILAHVDAEPLQMDTEINIQINPQSLNIIRPKKRTLLI